jgi:hypothetical protein
MDTRKLFFNKTFNQGDGSGHLNACVGENGYVDKQTYGTGFAEAVDILTAALEASDERTHLDTLIYPICFCARHHVELFLKAQIEAISSMREVSSSVPGKPNASISSTHDLSNLWTIFSRIALSTDRRYAAPVAQIEEFVRDIAQIDPTGQTFRYPSDTESVKHLVATPVINVASLRRRFMELVEKIQNFESLSEVLLHEYRYGVFTKKLSRSDLEYIATQLPVRSSWAAGTEFAGTKARLMELFSISSNDFSRAVCAIEKHHEFSRLIGIQIPITGLNMSTIEMLNRVFKDELRCRDWTGEDMVVIETIYEIARPVYLSEEFESVREHVRRDYGQNGYSDGEIRQRARTIPRFIEGLRKMGQLDLAQHAKQSLSAISLLDRLEKENAEFMKRYPKITGYQAQVQADASDKDTLQGQNDHERGNVD